MIKLPLADLVTPYAIYAVSYCDHTIDYVEDILNNYITPYDSYYSVAPIASRAYVYIYADQKLDSSFESYMMLALNAPKIQSYSNKQLGRGKSYI